MIDEIEKYLHVTTVNIGIIRVKFYVIMIQSHENNIDNDAKGNKQFCKWIEH